MTTFRKAVIDFIGEGVGVVPFPVRIPIDEALPAIALSLVSDFSEHVHTGPSGLIEQRIQLDIYAEDHDATDLLAEQVRVLLDGYRGPLGAGVTAGHIHLENELDGDEVGTRSWRRIQDYLVGYNAVIGS